MHPPNRAIQAPPSANTHAPLGSRTRRVVGWGCASEHSSLPSLAKVDLGFGEDWTSVSIRFDGPLALSGPAAIALCLFGGPGQRERGWMFASAQKSGPSVEALLGRKSFCAPCERAFWCGGEAQRTAEGFSCLANVRRGARPSHRRANRGMAATRCQRRSDNMIAPPAMVPTTCRGGAALDSRALSLRIHPAAFACPSPCLQSHALQLRARLLRTSRGVAIQRQSNAEGCVEGGVGAVRVQHTSATARWAWFTKGLRPSRRRAQSAPPSPPWRALASM